MRWQTGFWFHGCIIFTTPEKLVNLPTSSGYIAILLLDPQSVVYNSRGSSPRFHWKNDRPGHLNKFRQRHAVENWAPPLLLWTRKPPKSLNTDLMLVPFGIDGWKFVRGTSLIPGDLACTLPNTKDDEGEPFEIDEIDGSTWVNGMNNAIHLDWPSLV